MVVGTPTLKLSDVVADVQAAFGDTSGVQIKTADIARWTNQAQRDIVSRNGFNKKKADVASVAGTQIYTLPTDIVSIESILFDGIIIAPIGYEAAQNQYGANLLKQGIPSYWYTLGNDIYLYPVPNSVKNISMIYVASPMLVSSENDLLSVPDRYFNTVVQFVLAKAYELDEDWNAQQVKSMNYEKGVNELSNSDQPQAGAFTVITDPRDLYDYDYYGGLYGG